MLSLRALPILTLYATFPGARIGADYLWQGKSSLGILGAESCFLHPSACAHMSGITHWVSLIFQELYFCLFDFLFRQVCNLFCEHN